MQIKREKSPKLSDFSLPLAIVRLIVGDLLEAPEIRFHRFLAIRLILLGEEGLLVGGDLREIFRTCINCRCDSSEAVAACHLVSRYRSRTLVAVGIEGVQTLAVGVLRRSTAVGCHQIITVIVTVLLFRSLSANERALT